MDKGGGVGWDDNGRVQRGFGKGTGRGDRGDDGKVGGEYDVRTEN